MLNRGTLKRINERPRKARLLPLAGVGAGAAALGGALLALAPTPLLALTAVPVGALGLLAAHRAERARALTTLDYDNLGAEDAARFSTMQEALEALSSSEALWRLGDGQGKLSGASSIASAPERTPARVGELETPGIRTDIPIWGIEAADESLMFFPEALLVYRDDCYEGVSYRSVKVDLSFTRFFEKEEVPEDAQVLERERRRAGESLYSYGPEVRTPVVLYGLVEITLPRSREVRLQVSSLEAATRFAEAFGAKADTQAAEREERAAYEPPPERAESAHEVLGVREDASMREISAAYKKLAITYHPDKVLELPAEAREFSEQRMKEINAAYTELKRLGRASTQAG
jgi:DnaJ domain